MHQKIINVSKDQSTFRKNMRRNWYSMTSKSADSLLQYSQALKFKFSGTHTLECDRKVYYMSMLVEINRRWGRIACMEYQRP